MSVLVATIKSSKFEQTQEGTRGFAGRVASFSPRGELLTLQNAAGNQAVAELVQAGGRADKFTTNRGIFNSSATTEALSFIAASKGRAVDESTRSQTESRTGMGLDKVYIHDDFKAQLAATLLGAHAFSRGGHVYLGPTVNSPLGPTTEAALRHEMVHVAQVRMGSSTGRVSSSTVVEHEAEQLAGQTASPVDLIHGASAEECYGLWWLLPLAAAAYVLLRPNVANAPAPGRPTRPSVSELQVAGEAFALFAVPGGAFSAGGRLGLGIYGSSALAGASATVSFRGVQDVGRGEFSGVGTYIVDATTGAVIGIVVPGGIRLQYRKSHPVPVAGSADHFRRS
jgi:hypothetical protein